MASAPRVPGMMLVAEFENSYKNLFSVLSNPAFWVKMSKEERDRSFEEAFDYMKDSAGKLDSFFLWRRLTAMKKRPDMRTKEDMDSLKDEFKLKDDLLAKYRQKLGQWRQMLKEGKLPFDREWVDKEVLARDQPSSLDNDGTKPDDDASEAGSESTASDFTILGDETSVVNAMSSLVTRASIMSSLAACNTGASANPGSSDLSAEVAGASASAAAPLPPNVPHFTVPNVRMLAEYNKPSAAASIPSLASLGIDEQGADGSPVGRRGRSGFMGEIAKRENSA